MKKVFTLLALWCIVLHSLAQTGIGTSTPNASAKLDVYATNMGFLPPRVSLMSTSDATTIVSPAVGLLVYNIGSSNLQAGYYYWSGTTWATIVVASGNLPTPGDVKSGFQTTDHNGWIKMDGRLRTTLTTKQQAQATALGFVNTLPDASNSYLSQNGGSMGAVAGSNTVVLSQANLPNVNFTGTSGNNGNHAHNVDPPLTYTSTDGNHYHDMGFNNDDYNGSGGGNQSLEDDGGGWSYRGTTTNGNHNHSVDIPNTASTTNGDHNHSISLSSGGSAAAISTAPKTLSVTMFIYLGN